MRDRMRAALPWVASFAGATLVALLAASHIELSPHEVLAGGVRSRAWSMALRLTFTDWYAWGLLAPFIFWLANRFPVAGRTWWRALLVHLACGTAFAFAQLGLHVLVDVVISLLRPEPLDALEHFHMLVRLRIFPNFGVYLAIAGGSHAIRFGMEARRREARASQLEARLAEARLQVLKVQLQPHFLFNTLHAISTLMHADVDRAERMLVRLGDLLRLSLDTAGDQEVTLRQELEHLRPYLEIEEVRFGDRLRVEQDVDPAALDARVPHLVLQPLVENAVRHGIERRAAAGTIRIRAAVAGDVLRLAVEDDGPGLPAGASVRYGTGLANTAARLEALHGDRASLAIAGRPEGGFEAVVQVPLAPGARPRPAREGAHVVGPAASVLGGVRDAPAAG